MKVFYNPTEQDYAPKHSFFNGAMVPYPDVPGRTQNILEAIGPDPRFQVEPPPAMNPQIVSSVHGEEYLEALQDVCQRLSAEEEFFPFLSRPWPLLLRSPYPRIRMGYYAVDGSTPLLPNSFTTSLGASATALAGAEAILSGAGMVYAMPRPPGHHAGRESFAGYCITNHSALAAQLLSQAGPVAILDVDYHHGNGTQDIFYEREDVLYISIHCRPEEAYPYIAGSYHETGYGPGLGRNINMPLSSGTRWVDYQEPLADALERIQRFNPEAVVLSAGFDTLADDPIGTFRLTTDDFTPMGKMISQLGKPLLVVQEGGYHVPSLGACVLGLFNGLGLT